MTSEAPTVVSSKAEKDESPNIYFAIHLARAIAPKSYGVNKRIELLDRILLSLDAAFERGEQHQKDRLLKSIQLGKPEEP